MCWLVVEDHLRECLDGKVSETVTARAQQVPSPGGVRVTGEQLVGRHTRLSLGRERGGRGRGVEGCSVIDTMCNTVNITQLQATTYIQ